MQRDTVFHLAPFPHIQGQTDEPVPSGSNLAWSTQRVHPVQLPIFQTEKVRLHEGIERNELWSQPDLVSTLESAISEELLNTLGLRFLTCETGLLRGSSPRGAAVNMN